MRVVLVITKGELGGAQTHVAELCAALRESHDFLVLIGGGERSPLNDVLTALDVPVQSLPGLGNAGPGRAVLASVRQIARHARSWDADVIHVHSAVAAAVGRVAGCLAGIPVVYTVHGFAFKPQVPAVRRLTAFAAERLLAPLSTHFICVSAAERELAKKLGTRPDRVSVISNGISDTPLRAQPAGTPPRLVMVARMAAPKRHDLLLRALQVLRSRGMAPLETVFAGAGPLMATWQKAADAAALAGVNFCGDVSDVPERLAHAHVFVLLSDHEGQPISIIEAMRAGLPILASDLPGVRAQITDGVEGLLTPNQPAEIADRLHRLIADPLLRLRMGAAARRRFETEFSAMRMASEVARIYQQCARAPRSAPRAA